MAARAGGRGSGGDEVGELSEALRVEIEEQVGGRTVEFIARKDFGVAGAVFLSERLRGNTTVETLWLGNCGLGAVGARALAEVLCENNNSALTKLDLFGNRSMGADGTVAMAQMLRKNTTLDQLNLANCGMGDQGARALGEALKDNFTLNYIFLNFSDFGDDAVRALAEALRWNESLKMLGLGNCPLTTAGASSLLSALRECNSTLISLQLFENRGIENSAIKDSIKELLEENEAVVPETAERRARCLLFCCLRLAPTAHEHVVPSIGAVPVPVMQYAVEHAGKLHVAKRFEHGNLVAGQSSAGVRARSSSLSDSSDDCESATPRRR